jgi:hypothetical protein
MGESMGFSSVFDDRAGVQRTGREGVAKNQGLAVTIATAVAGITAAGVALTMLGGTISLMGFALGGLASVLGVILSPKGRGSEPLDWGFNTTVQTWRLRLDEGGAKTCRIAWHTDCLPDPEALARRVQLGGALAAKMKLKAKSSALL